MKIKNQFLLGIIVGVVGVVMFSSKAVMVKMAYHYNVDALDVLLLRMLFSFPFYVAIAIISKPIKLAEGNTATNRDYLWVILFVWTVGIDIDWNRHLMKHTNLMCILT